MYYYWFIRKNTQLSNLKPWKHSPPDIRVVSKDIYKDSISKTTELSCLVSGLSVDRNLTWTTDNNNGVISNAHSDRFLHGGKTSVLSVTLQSAADTQFTCSVESEDSTNFIGSEQVASVFVYGQLLSILFCLTFFST